MVSKSTVIVVPCFNEAQRLYTLRFREFAESHPEVRFLFVNDGSRDHTLLLLLHLQANNPDAFEILNLPQNCGKAEAVRRGVLQAATMQPDCIGFWDADLATPLEAIPQFIAALDRRPEVSLALGVRLPLLGHRIERHPLRRRLGQMFCYAASLILGAPFTDTQCGAKLFRATPEVLAAFARPFHSRWIFDVEILARLHALGSHQSPTFLDDSVYELPLDSWRDVAGSKLKSSDFVKAFGELTAIWWHYLRPGAPAFTAPAALGHSTSDQVPNTQRRAA